MHVIPLRFGLEIQTSKDLGGPSSSCESLEMILRNSGHGENMSLYGDIYDVLQKKKYNKIIIEKTLSYFHGVSLVVWQSNKFYTGRFRPKVKPLTLLFTIYDRKKRYPFRTPSIDRYPFHIISLGLSIPFNFCKSTVFEI